MTRIPQGVEATAAAARPLAAAHSIWEIMLHATSWTRELTRRLGGALPAEPLAEDWPDVGAATPERWAAAAGARQASGARRWLTPTRTSRRPRAWTVGW